MKGFFSLMLLSVLLLAGSAESATLEEELAYGAGKPLDVKVVGTEKKAGVMIEDVTFSSVAGNLPIEAYVVRPESGAGPFAGVLFVHWYAPRHPNSNRTQYLEEAQALARRGTVSLLVSTFWSDANRYRSRKWENDYQNSLNQAKDLRRALDVLLAQPGVDPKRIAYVGHDYGAMFGSVVASVDPRPKAFVLIAGTARFPDWYLFGSSTGVPKGDDLTKFKEQFALIDPVSAIAKTRASVFFQFGEMDKFTPRDNFIEFYKAAPDPKRIATYSSEHAMDAEIIRYDRDVWLAEQLVLGK
jgi:dienelactone hydrolase